MRRALVVVIALLALFVVLWRATRDDEPMHAQAGLQARAATSHATPAMPPDGRRLEGRVIDEQDHPVADATITIDERRATSDADGTFAFDVPYGRYRLAGIAGERYVQETSIVFDATSAPIVLRAVRGPALVVKVRGDGKPLAGAEVRLDDEAAGVTDANGIARITGRVPDSYDVSARGAGFARDSRYVRIEPGTADTIAELDLVHGAALSGIVVDEQNKRVAAANVVVTLLADGYHTTPAVADASGAWRVDALAEGRYHVSAQADGLGPTIGAPIALDGKTPRDGIVVRVSAGGTLFGKVMDPEKRPVAGVKIQLQQEARVDWWQAISDEQGRYEIRGLPEGSYLVMRFTGRSGYTQAHATIVQGQRTEQDLVVDDDHVDGVVVDAKGTPLAGVFVEADSETDVTDARGRFEVVFRKAEKHELRASRQRNEIVRSPPIEVTGAAHDVRIVLADGGSVTGRVMLDGKPVGDYAIAIAPASDADMLSLGDHSLHTTDGRFALRDVPPGSWRVVVAAAGCDVSFTAVTAVEPNKVADVGDITLARGRRITGRVRDPSGVPVAGARVILNEEPSPWHTPMSRRFELAAETVSDTAGEFVFEGVSRRTRYPRVTLTASHPQLGISPQVEVESDRVELVLAATGAIDGIVEDFAGDQTFFVAQSENASSSSTEVNRAGEFHIENVPPGIYTIRESMSSTHRRIVPAKVTVEAGRRTRARVRLDLATVAVRFAIASECHDEVSLAAQDDASSGAAGGPVSCTNPSTLPYVAPGTYRACDRERRCATVKVAAAPALQTIELRLVAPPADP